MIIQLADWKIKEKSNDYAIENNPTIYSPVGCNIGDCINSITSIFCMGFKLDKQHVTNILLIIVVIIGSIGLYSLLTRKNVADDSQLKTIISSKDDLIQEYKSQRDIARAEKDSAISKLNYTDSILQIKQQTITIKHAQIKPYILSLDKDSLRAAGEKFQPK